MDNTLIKKAELMLLAAPTAHVFRMQMVHAAIISGTLLHAAQLLIDSATEKSDKDWNKTCLQFAEKCLKANKDRLTSQRKFTVATLLGMQGQRAGIKPIDIDAAVQLASVHLDRGHSSARALFEGQQLLLSQFNRTNAL